MKACLIVPCLWALSSAAAGTVQADAPPDFVALGAYLSWERIAANAKALGADRWVDLGRRLDAIAARHANLLWVTNMAVADLPRLIRECRRRRLRLLPSMAAIEAKVKWRWAHGGRYYDEWVPRVIHAAGPAKNLVGWVLSDEPRKADFPHLANLRNRFRRLDPLRFCTIVAMWPQAPLAARTLQLPVVCVDLYPFFGPEDPNGPHTDAASRSFFRRNAAALVRALPSRNAAAWIMGMAFCDVWGPRRYDARWHLLGLPGAYLHWRAPTPAEMRWQVWETFRSGAKGFVCYTLAPEAPNPRSAALPPPRVKWKKVLAKHPVDMGPNALTNPDGSATPQLEALGRAYARVQTHAALVQHWQPWTGEPVLEVGSPAHIGLFAVPGKPVIYAIVVNDDLKRSRTLSGRVGETIETVRDVVAQKPLILKKDFAGGSAAFQVSLAPGDGTILALEPQKPTPAPHR